MHFLQLKTTIGKRTRDIYRNGTKEELDALIGDYDRLLTLLEEFYHAHKKLWFLEKKPHGFDVQDIRMGGLMQRIASCTQRLMEYACGKISVIEELEEDILPEYPQQNVRHNNWLSQATANVISFGAIGR